MVSWPPLWTPPMPPVTNTGREHLRLPLVAAGTTEAAATRVPETVVPPSRPPERAKGKSRRLT